MTKVQTARPYRKRLIAAALRGQKKAYKPYTNFPVGAAVLARIKGVLRIVIGHNWENATMTRTRHAERHAIRDAYDKGMRMEDGLIAIAVVGDTEDPVYPCFLCRQDLAECSPVDDPVAIFCCSKGGKRVDDTTLAVLYPHQFPSRSAAEMLLKRRRGSSTK